MTMYKELRSLKIRCEKWADNLSKIFVMTDKIAAGDYVSLVRPRSMGQRMVVNPHPFNVSKDLLEDIDSFIKNHNAHNSGIKSHKLLRVKDSIKNAQDLISQEEGIAEMLVGRVVRLQIIFSSIDADLTAILDSFDVEIQQSLLVERAFAYIQKMLLASESYRKDWLDATGAKVTGEVTCEKLGEAALLLAGIWAVKMNQTIGETDLVLSLSDEEGNVDAHALRTGTFVLLTEWKIAHTRKEFEQRIEQAKQQSALYLQDSLSTYKVNDLVYLVICTKDRMTDLAAQAEVELNAEAGRRAFRVINLHLDTTSASKAAKQLAST